MRKSFSKLKATSDILPRVIPIRSIGPNLDIQREIRLLERSYQTDTCQYRIGSHSFSEGDIGVNSEYPEGQRSRRISDITESRWPRSSDIRRRQEDDTKR